ncbi:ribonuclease H-like domain-containing protein [Tanacetum coccineum]
MEDDVDINALTIEQYIALIPDDIKPGIVNPKIGDDVEFEINANFMRELRRKLFAGTDDEDAYEHVRTVLEIVDLFHFPGVTHDAIMLRVFPITLKGRALRWKDRLPAGSITTWDLLKKEFIWRYCHPFITAKKLEEIRNFKQERDETLYYAWERYNDLLYQLYANHRPPNDFSSPQPDDDYVAPATNPTSNKQSNKFEEEFSHITEVAEKEYDNPVIKHMIPSRYDTSPLMQLKRFKRLVAYAKCIRDSYKSELGPGHFYHLDFCHRIPSDSVGTSTAQVILFGTIPTAIPTTIPIVDPPIVSTLLHTSPFLYIDLSDSDTSNRPPKQDPMRVHVLSVETISHRIRGFISATDYKVSSEESYEPYTEPDIDFDVQEDIDACIAADGAATATETDVRVEVYTRINKEDEDDKEAESSHRGTMEIGVDIVVEPVMSEDTPVPTDKEDTREDFLDLVSADRSQEVVQIGLDVVMQELYDHMVDIHVDWITGIEAGQRELEASSLISARERADMSERIRTFKRDNMRLKALLCIERERIDSLQCHMAYTQEDLRQIHRFCYYDRIEFRRLETYARRHLGYRP